MDGFYSYLIREFENSFLYLTMTNEEFLGKRFECRYTVVSCPFKGNYVKAKYSLSFSVLLDKYFSDR